MSNNHGCPDCGSTSKKHSPEDCDMAQAGMVSWSGDLLGELPLEGAFDGGPHSLR